MDTSRYRRVAARGRKITAPALTRHDSYSRWAGGVVYCVFAQVPKRSIKLAARNEQTSVK